MTSLYLEDIFDSEFGFGYGAIVNGIGYIPIPVESIEIECNCTQHEINMFFESVSNMDLNYEDDFWFAETQLWNDLLIHSVDTRVGF